MSRVSLHFEDAEDGQIAFRADYVHGLDMTSPAHRIANQVIMFLDQQAKTKTHETITPTDGGAYREPQCGAPIVQDS